LAPPPLDQVLGQKYKLSKKIEGKRGGRDKGKRGGRDKGKKWEEGIKKQEGF